MIVWLDCETRSRCNLITRGGYVYAGDPSTEALRIGYAIDDGPVQMWEPSYLAGGSLDLSELQRIARMPDLQIRAHNAAFDRLILNRVLGLNIPLEAFYCTATQARANCMPGSLEDIGRFIGTGMRKDYRGKQLIKALSIPRADGSFDDDPALMKEMAEYCATDVRVMREASKAMRELTEEELLDYHVNERINDLGVRIDVDLCKAALPYTDAEVQSFQAKVLELTDGEITTVRSPKLREWVKAHVGPEALKLMGVYRKDKKTGEERKKYSIDKAVRANLIAFSEENPDEVPPIVKEVIQCTDNLWASSTAKFRKLLDMADPEDQRVRGAFVFAGGSATGRASSYGAQVHNFPRKCAKEPEKVRAALIAGRKIVPEFGARVSDVLKGMLRAAMIPADGHVFVLADWSSVEGRVNPWLANTELAERKLDIYREHRDPYIINAMAMYGCSYDEVTKEQRQVGKVMELALSYMGGKGSFATFSRNFGVAFTVDEVQSAIQVWQRANQWCLQSGRALERAYIGAMRHPGKEFSAGRITYYFDGVHLWFMLPSGRVLNYPFATHDAEGISYAKSSWKPAQDATEWPRARLWPGLALENCWAKDTKIVTKAGLKSIVDITNSDEIWDGFAWVTSDGAVFNGEQETTAWIGTRVTKNHQIYDGTQWKSVMDLDVYTTNGCLKLGRSLVPAEFWPLKLRGLLGWCAHAVWNLSWPRGTYAEGLKGCAENAVLSKLRRTKTKNRLYQILKLDRYGYIVFLGRSLAARIQSIKRMLTTEGGVLRSIASGWRIKTHGFATFKHYLGGMLYGLTSTGSIITRATYRGISAWFRGKRTYKIGEIRDWSGIKAKMCPSQNFGEKFALSGVATTRLPTTLKQDDQGMKSQSAIKKREIVYDIMNCGPRHQYMVMTDYGPVIAHNCTQATSNDLLRHALRELDDLYYRIPLHVHDEIVLEVPKDKVDQAIKDLTRYMTKDLPAWAAGLPLEIEVKTLSRYGK